MDKPHTQSAEQKKGSNFDHMICSFRFSDLLVGAPRASDSDKGRVFVYVNNKMVSLIFFFVQSSPFVHHLCRDICFLFLNFMLKSNSKLVDQTATQSGQSVNE